MIRWPMIPAGIHGNAGVKSLPVSFAQALPKIFGWNQIRPPAI